MKKPHEGPDYVAYIAAAVLAIGFWLAMNSARADPGDVWLDLNVASAHSEPCYDSGPLCRPFNEANNGLGLTYELSDAVSVSAGYFENSYYRISRYASVTFEQREKIAGLDVVLGAEIGVVSGYEEDEAPPVYVLPNLSVGNERVQATIGYVPEFGDSVGVATFQVRVRINR